MPSVTDTAYPRFKINPSAKSWQELNELYTPTVYELAFARERARQPLQRAGLLLLLKTFQRLGYFAVCAEIPSPTHGRDSGKISKQPSDGTAPEMSQPTSIQMLDTAIWKELGVEEVAESEAFYHALATLLSRWLLARSEYPEMEAIKLFAKVRAYVAQPERLL